MDLNNCENRQNFEIPLMAQPALPAAMFFAIKEHAVVQRTLLKCSDVRDVSVFR